MTVTLPLQTMVQSSNLDIDLPQGYVWYETMIVLRPDLTEEERCVQPYRSHAMALQLCVHILYST